MPDIAQEHVRNVIRTEFVRFENQFFGVSPVGDSMCSCETDQGCCKDVGGNCRSPPITYDEVNEIINGRYDLLQEYVTSKKEPIKNFFNEVLI